jgi:transcriptional regulator with XRE-family HTH domain
LGEVLQSAGREPLASALNWQRREALVSEDWAGIAEAIKTRLTDLRMTQLDLASRSKVSPATIGELVTNRNPRRRQHRTLEALSEALDWPAGYLDAVLRGEDPATLADDDDPVLAELVAMREEMRRMSERLDALERSDNPPT